MEVWKNLISEGEIKNYTRTLWVLEELHDRRIGIEKRQWEKWVSDKHWTEGEFIQKLRLSEDGIMPCRLLHRLFYDACRILGFSPRALTVSEEGFLISNNLDHLKRAISDRWIDYDEAFKFLPALADIVGENRYNRYYLHYEKIMQSRLSSQVGTIEAKTDAAGKDNIGDHGGEKPTYLPERICGTDCPRDGGSIPVRTRTR